MRQTTLPVRFEIFGKRGYARLRGLVLNAKNIENEREIVEKAVQEIGTQIVCYVPRSSEIQEAENQGGTVFEFLTDSVMQAFTMSLQTEFLQMHDKISSKLQPTGRKEKENEEYKVSGSNYGRSNGSKRT